MSSLVAPVLAFREAQSHTTYAPSYSPDVWITFRVCIPVTGVRTQLLPCASLLKVVIHVHRSHVLASTSRAHFGPQVYKATLRSTGEDVAVKVQRPGIGESIAVDMLLLRYAFPQALLSCLHGHGVYFWGGGHVCVCVCKSVFWSFCVCVRVSVCV